MYRLCYIHLEYSSSNAVTSKDVEPVLPRAPLAVFGTLAQTLLDHVSSLISAIAMSTLMVNVLREKKEIESTTNSYARVPVRPRPS